MNANVLICLLLAGYGWSCSPGRNYSSTLDRYRAAAEYIRLSSEVSDYLHHFDARSTPEEIHVMDSVVYMNKLPFYDYVGICHYKIDSSDSRARQMFQINEYQNDVAFMRGKGNIHMPQLNSLNRGQALADTSFVIFFSPIRDGIALAELVRKSEQTNAYSELVRYTRTVRFMFNFDRSDCPFSVSSPFTYD